jgi:hypothetical protein
MAEDHEKQTDPADVPLHLDLTLAQGLSVAMVISLAINSPLGEAIKAMDEAAEDIGNFLVAIHNAVIEQYGEAIGDVTQLPDIAALKADPTPLEESLKTSTFKMAAMDAEDAGVVEKPEDWIEGKGKDE